MGGSGLVKFPSKPIPKKSCEVRPKSPPPPARLEELHEVAIGANLGRKKLTSMEENGRKKVGSSKKWHFMIFYVGKTW
jgi:hypothetical protein